jgi:hypothetical protein
VLPKPQPRRLAAQDDKPGKPPKRLRGAVGGGDGPAAGLGG